jgi:hypothetical protein
MHSQLTIPSIIKYRIKETPHINCDMTDDRGMVWQSNILALVVDSVIPCSTIPNGFIVDDKGALNIDLNGGGKRHARRSRCVVGACGSVPCFTPVHRHQFLARRNCAIDLIEKDLIIWGQILPREVTLSLLTACQASVLKLAP